MSNSQDRVFETERLYACKWSMDHAEVAFELYGDADVTRFIGGPAADLAAMRERMLGIIERNRKLAEPFGSFPMFHRADDAYVGTALIRPLPDPDGNLTEDVEIGWHLARRFWRQGFATEIGQRLIQVGWDSGLDVLHVVVDPANVRSLAVAARLNIPHVGRSVAYYHGEPVEHFVLHRMS